MSVITASVYFLGCQTESSHANAGRQYKIIHQNSAKQGRDLKFTENIAKYLAKKPTKFQQNISISNREMGHYALCEI